MENETIDIGAVFHVDDLEIKCIGCNEIFIFRGAEREFYSNRKMTEPKYCPICRTTFREKKKQELKRQEDAEWTARREEEYRKYVAELNNWNVVSLKEVKPDMEDKPLYVIGNGFDLMHGARSSYYDFSKTLGKRNRLRFYLENYLKVDDLWADFEGALAKINVEAMCSSIAIDTFLDSMGAYEEEAGAAEFFGAAEMAADPIISMNTALKKRFRDWVCTLETNTDDRPLKDIIQTGKVLNFNYTEFIENLYGADESNICYIHGCRRKRKGFPKEELILGHKPGDSDREYEFEDRYSGIRISGNRAQVIYDAQQTALQFITEADEGLTKDCDKIIEKHSCFFAELSDINRIITIGHSLYPVDWDYFREIMDNNSAKDSIRWYFGCHGIKDLVHIGNFVDHFGLDKSRVFIFRTDLIHVSLFQEDACVFGKSNHNSHGKTHLGVSDNGKWEIICEGKKVSILKKQTNAALFTRIFSVDISGCVFDSSSMCLFLVARGLYEGIFLLRFEDNEWRYIHELEGIPNQGVITKRLRRIVLNDGQITFIYNSRVRKYDVTDGKLVYNKPAQRAFEQKYEGEDLTEKFREIYRTGFY